MKSKLLTFAAMTVSLTLLVLFSSCGNEVKKETGTVVFMDSFKVFDEFRMKKDYDQRLEKELTADKQELDALGMKLNGSKDGLITDALKKEFTLKKMEFDQKFESLSKQYTDDVYKRLNTYISDYGKEHSYKLILGSGGEGNVMYVDTSVNITTDLILYINKKYSN